MADRVENIEAGEVEFSLKIKPIAQILFLGLIFRLLLSSLPGFEVDIGAFRAWAGSLAARGAWDFFGEGFHTEFTPGYLYYLWALGGLDTIFRFSPERYEFLLKLVPIAADLGSAYLLYILLEGQKPALRLAAAIVYLLHPVVLLITPVWGQTDSILAFFLFLSVYFITRGKLTLAALAYVIGFLVKPQAIAVLPLFLFWGFRDYPPREWLRAGGVAIGAFVLLLVPFFADDPLGPFEEMRRSTEVYPYNSFWAFNFWALFDRFKPDDITFWGITWHDWGIALFALAIGAIIFVFRKERRPGMMALAVSLSVLAMYLFLTRMHERYVFAAFLPMVLALFLSNHRYLTWVLAAGFVVLSIVNFLNVYEVYMYYGRYINSPQEPTDLFKIARDHTFFYSLVATLTFPALLATGYMLMRHTRAAE